MFVLSKSVIETSILPNYFKLYQLRMNMADFGQESGYGDRFFSDVNTRLRDLEEKQRLLKDKMLLVTEGLIREREKNFSDIQDLKKTVGSLKMDNERLKEILSRIGEIVDTTARKEDLLILQRQFDILRER